MERSIRSFRKLSCTGILVFAISASTAHAVHPEAVWRNNEGINHLAEENAYKAYQSFVQGLAYEPFQPEIHLNLGLSYEVNEEFEKALKEYKAAAKLSQNQDVLRFQALFNAARVTGQMGDIDQALALYQEALEVNPESKEVKTNIELLWMSQSGKGGKGSSQSNKKQDPQEDGDQDGEQQQDQPQDQSQGQQPQQQQQKQQPKPFDSKELTKDDVRKILEELKNQEQEIRADAYRKGAKEAPRDKNW